MTNEQQSRKINGYPTYAFLAGLVAGLLIMVLYRWAAMPNIPEPPEVDNNTACYIGFINALESGQYTEVEATARDVQQRTTDADLRKLARMFRRHAELAQECNIETFDESGSLGGMIKASLTGFLNPLAGLEGLSQFIELLVTDYDAISRRVDDRYQPEIVSWLQTQEQIQSAKLKAKAVGTRSIWILIIVTLVLTVLLIAGREQFESGFAERDDADTEYQPPHADRASQGVGTHLAEEALLEERSGAGSLGVSGHKVIQCKSCSQKLRVPATHSTLSVRCNACGHRFDYP